MRNVSFAGATGDVAWPRASSGSNERASSTAIDSIPPMLELFSLIDMTLKRVR